MLTRHLSSACWARLKCPILGSHAEEDGLSLDCTVSTPEDWVDQSISDKATDVEHQHGTSCASQLRQTVLSLESVPADRSAGGRNLYVSRRHRSIHPIRLSVPVEDLLGGCTAQEELLVRVAGERSVVDEARVSVIIGVGLDQTLKGVGRLHLTQVKVQAAQFLHNPPSGAWKTQHDSENIFTTTVRHPQDPPTGL